MFQITIEARQCAGATAPGAARLVRAGAGLARRQPRSGPRRLTGKFPGDLRYLKWDSAPQCTLPVGSGAPFRPEFNGPGPHQDSTHWHLACRILLS